MTSTLVPSSVRRFSLVSTIPVWDRLLNPAIMVSCVAQAAIKEERVSLTRIVIVRNCHPVLFVTTSLVTHHYHVQLFVLRSLPRRMIPVTWIIDTSVSTVIHCPVMMTVMPSTPSNAGVMRMASLFALRPHVLRWYVLKHLPCVVRHVHPLWVMVPVCIIDSHAVLLEEEAEVIQALLQHHHVSRIRRVLVTGPIIKSIVRNSRLSFVQQKATVVR